MVRRITKPAPFCAGMALLAMAAACTDGVAPTASGNRPIHLALAPQFHASQSSSSAALQRARVTIVDNERHDTIAGPLTAEVNPSAAAWSLPITFEVPNGRTRIVALVELLSVDDGVETAQWSGLTTQVAIADAIAAPVPVTVDLYPGPAENLAVRTILIDSARAQISEGDSVPMRAHAVGSTRARIFWRVSDTAVANIDGSGMLRSRRDGVVRIRAEAGPASDSIQLRVRARPYAIRLTPDTARLSSLGEDVVFAGVIVDKRGAGVDGDSIRFESADESVARNLGGGRFAAVSNGTAAVRLTSHTEPNVSNTAVFIVSQRVASVTLDAATFDFDAPGQTHTFHATARDGRSNGMAAGMSWSSSDTRVITVNASGVVTAVAPGAATVSASSSDGPAATARVTVRQRVTSVTAKQTQLRMTALGDTATLAMTARDASGNTIVAPTYKWSSSAANVATVDTAGFVRAGANGSARITATIDGLSAFVDIDVQQQVASIVVQPDSVVVAQAGATLVFAARLADRRGNVMQGAAVQWSSSDNSVATSNGGGQFTARGNGVATITAVSGDVGTGAPGGGPAITANARAIVRIPRPPVLVSVTPVTASVGAGARTQLLASVTNDTTGILSGVTWTSSNGSIATVDANGLVTGVAQGAATITAASRFDPNVSASAVVTVTQVATTVTLTPSTGTLTVGDTLRLSGAITGSTNVRAAGLRYSTSNSGVASVNAVTGAVVAVAPGSAVITATAVADTARRATSTITVVPPAAVITSVLTDKGGPVALNNVKGPIVVTAVITAVLNPINHVDVGIDSNVECTQNFSPTINNGQGSATVTCKIKTEERSDGQFTYPDGPHTIFVRAIDTNGVAYITRLSIVTNN